MSREKIVEDCLGIEDEIQKSFEARLDGAYGILFMSKRRLLFITEKGRFRKRYDLILDLPYEKIKSLRTERDYTLIIEDVLGLKYAFISVLRGQIVEKALVELMAQEPS